MSLPQPRLFSSEIMSSSPPFIQLVAMSRSYCVSNVNIVIVIIILSLVEIFASHEVCRPIMHCSEHCMIAMLTIFCLSHYCSNYICCNEYFSCLLPIAP